jgi:hypothetical protein
MTVTANDIDRVQKSGREARDWSLIALGFAFVWLVVEIAIAPLLPLAGGATLIEIATRLRDALIKAAPVLIFTGGLWSAQKLFRRVGEGDVFSPANAAGVRDIGLALIWGGIVAAVVPAAQGLVAREPFHVTLDGWQILVVALGGAILLFGRIWAIAVAIKADADQII